MKILLSSEVFGQENKFAKLINLVPVQSTFTCSKLISIVDFEQVNADWVTGHESSTNLVSQYPTRHKLFSSLDERKYIENSFFLRNMHFLIVFGKVRLTKKILSQK